jgi:hypothetical protein
MEGGTRARECVFPSVCPPLPRQNAMVSQRTKPVGKNDSRLGAKFRPVSDAAAPTCVVCAKGVEEGGWRW